MYLRFIFPVFLLVGVVTSDDKKVSVNFYGEAGCPACQQFVIDDLPTVLDDKELEPHVKFNFFPWGNSYFGTKKCGTGPYDSEQRECWVRLCHDTPNNCFQGIPVNQHGAFEGELNVYEGCAKHQEQTKAVHFLRCVEKRLQDVMKSHYDHVSVHKIMTLCGKENDLDIKKLKQCSKQNKKDRNIEIENARATPPHPGVPWIVVDGTPMDNLNLKQMVCQNLSKEGIKLPTCLSVSVKEDPQEVMVS